MSEEDSKQGKDMMNDPAIRKIEEDYYPSPSDWVVRKGRAVCIKEFYIENGQQKVKTHKTDILRPIWVQSIIENIATGTNALEIGFETNNGHKSFSSVSNNILSGTAANPEAKSLTARGASVNNGNFKTFIKLIDSYSTATKGVECKRGVDRFGWYGKGMTFILADALGEDKELLQLQTKDAVKHFRPKGSKEEWFEMFQDCILRHCDGAALFAFSTAMSSLLKGVLRAEFEFIPAILIYGPSGTGKTTAQMLIASAIGGAGLSSKDEGIMFSFNTTLNALQARMTSLGPVPCVVDEKSLEKETQGRKMVLDEILYTINSGVKDRLDSNSRVVDENRRVECSIVLSGETAEDLSGNTGKQYRLIQQKWTGFKGETDGSLANRIKHVVSSSSGHFLPVFIEHIVNNKDHLEVLYEQCESEAREILIEAGIPDISLVRMTPNLARAKLTCKIILICSGIDLEQAKTCMKAFDEEAVRVYKNNIIRPESERIPEKLTEGIITYINHFSLPNNNSREVGKKYTDPSSGEVWGRIFSDNEVGITGSALTKVVNDEFSSSQIRDAIKQLGAKRVGIKVLGFTSYVWKFNLPNQEAV